MRTSAQISSTLTPPEDAQRDLQKTTAQLQQQNNAGPQVLPYAKRGGGYAVPRGGKSGDQAVRVTPTGIAVRSWAGKGNKEVILNSVLGEINESNIGNILNASQYKGVQTGTNPPTVTEFPNSGDFGWFIDTTPSNQNFFVVNNSGSIITISPSTMGIAFTDVTGTITATQHGNFPAIAANDNLHAVATTARNGFLSAADKTLINTATDANTGSALCQRASNGDLSVQRIRCVAVNISTLDIVAGRVNGWSIPTFTPVVGKGSYDASLITLPNLARQVAALIQDLHASGGTNVKLLDT